MEHEKKDTMVNSLADQVRQKITLNSPEDQSIETIKVSFASQDVPNYLKWLKSAEEWSSRNPKRIS